jgi:2-phospho-L-lactate guanylyltransferase
MVINPDRRGSGTNALFVRPSGMISYTFGENSFRQHCAQAISSQISLKIVRLPSIELDLDLPEDLNEIRKLGVDFIK